MTVSSFSLVYFVITSSWTDITDVTVISSTSELASSVPSSLYGGIGGGGVGRWTSP